MRWLARSTDVETMCCAPATTTAIAVKGIASMSCPQKVAQFATPTNDRIPKATTTDHETERSIATAASINGVANSKPSPTGGHTPITCRTESSHHVDPGTRPKGITPSGPHEEPITVDIGEVSTQIVTATTSNANAIQTARITTTQQCRQGRNNATGADSQRRGLTSTVSSLLDIIYLFSVNNCCAT